MNTESQRLPHTNLLHELLYESFGEPRARAGLTKKSKKTRLPPLCEALYQWLKKQEWTQPIYDALIAPAEVTRNEKTFLDPEQFREIVKDRAPGLLNREAGETSEESSESALALFSLAFALLQPEDAVVIVEGVLPLSPQYESFFGVGVVDAPAEPPATDLSADSTTPDDVDSPQGEEPDGATPFSELQEALQQLRQEAGGLGKELIDAGTALQNEGRLPRSELITDLHRLRERLKALADQVTQISTTSVFPLRQETTPRSISSVLSDLKEAADIARKEEISGITRCRGENPPPGQRTGPYSSSLPRNNQEDPDTFGSNIGSRIRNTPAGRARSFDNAVIFPLKTTNSMPCETT